MATNLGIDISLLNEAVKVGKHKTKKEAVNQALKEYIFRRKQMEIVRIFGKIDFDPDYNYKKGRTRA